MAELQKSTGSFFSQLARFAGCAGAGVQAGQKAAEIAANYRKKIASPGNTDRISKSYKEIKPEKGAKNVRNIRRYYNLVEELAKP